MGTKAKKNTPGHKAAKRAGDTESPVEPVVEVTAASPDPEASTGNGEDGPRRLGIRGAAPWAARHAAKHAAEARARAAEPPPPGSARATLREPHGADELKAKIGALHTAIQQIRTLRKNLPRNFYDIGAALQEIRSQKLYEARGFGTFEAFLDRELDLGKIAALQLVRVVELFKKSAALEIGMDRIIQAVTFLDSAERAEPRPHPAPANSTPLPLRPPTPRKKR